MHDRVQHDHVEPHKDRRIEEVDQGGRISAEQIHVDSRCFKTTDSACKNQDQTDRPAPSAQFFDRLVLVFLVNDINNVGPFQITISCRAGESDHDRKKDCRQVQAPEIKPQLHLLAVHDKQSETAPQEKDEGNAGRDTKQ